MIDWAFLISWLMMGLVVSLYKAETTDLTKGMSKIDQQGFLIFCCLTIWPLLLAYISDKESDG